MHLQLKCTVSLAFGNDVGTCCGFAVCVCAFKDTHRNNGENELLEAMTFHICVVAKESCTASTIITSGMQRLLVLCQAKSPRSVAMLSSSFLSNPWNYKLCTDFYIVKREVHACFGSSNFLMLFSHLFNSLTCGAIQNAPRSESHERGH